MSGNGSFVAGIRGRAGRSILVALFLLFAVQAQAQWIRATGQAAVVYGDRERALAEAKDNALREAALKLRAQVSSEETVENGVLTHSRLTVNSRAQARELRVVSERIEGDYALVTIEADMVESGVCEGSQAHNFRKRVAVVGFALVQRQGAGLGRLYDAERALPEYLYQRLLAGGSLEPLSMSQRQLYGDVRNLPTVWAADNRVHKTLALARDLDVQFVVSGVIRDLGPVDTDAWGTSVIDGWKRGLGFTNRNRRFVMDLVVHDGFSGSPIMERRYQAVGIWDADKEADIGFLTPGFVKTPYGQAVSEVLEQAAADISAELRCQPFMTRITRVDDRQVYLATGASSGLRPGQELSIYRRFEFIDTPGDTYELQPTRTALRINQVHPDFSRGQIPVQAGRHNIQQDDIAIIW
jgi:hypothetical protein